MKAMDAVLGQDSVVAFLRTRLQNPPHILLYGPTGVGKTLLANGWIADQFAVQGVTRPEDRAAMTLRLSSADDRGITAIRQGLTEFVRRVRPVPNTFAWVIIDDADNLPVVTQQALRRILELYCHQTRFCFIAQSPSHFIEPIQSRCVLLQCNPVNLTEHLPTLAARELPQGPTIAEDAMDLIAGLAMGNARQATLICKAIRSLQVQGTVTSEMIHTLVNAPPVTLLLRLQQGVADRDLPVVTECVLALWSKGYSFEDCIAMLEMVVRVYNETLTADLQYVLQVCAEGHIYQILNRMTTLDLIAVLSGRASSEALSESL